MPGLTGKLITVKLVHSDRIGFNLIFQKTQNLRENCKLFGVMIEH